jgi:hypothetical protein
MGLGMARCGHVAGQRPDGGDEDQGVMMQGLAGATLGAIRMNGLVVLRMDVNNGQRQTRGSGLI